MMKRIACVTLIVLSTLACASCGNPFGSEDDPGNVYSPAIDDLVISRKSVYCGNNFSLTFTFDDKQGDIEFADLMIIGPTSSALIEDQIDWDHDGETAGTATVSYSIPCSGDFPSGGYAVRIKLEDRKGHESNQLTANIALL